MIHRVEHNPTLPPIPTQRLAGPGLTVLHEIHGVRPAFVDLEHHLAGDAGVTQGLRCATCREAGQGEGVGPGLQGEGVGLGLQGEGVGPGLQGEGVGPGLQGEGVGPGLTLTSGPQTPNPHRCPHRWPQTPESHLCPLRWPQTPLMHSLYPQTATPSCIASIPRLQPSTPPLTPRSALPLTCRHQAKAQVPEVTCNGHNVLLVLVGHGDEHLAALGQLLASGDGGLQLRGAGPRAGEGGGGGSGAGQGGVRHS